MGFNMSLVSTLYAEIDSLNLKLETMTADRDAEKSMKATARMQRDDMTLRNKVLRERPDLLADRIPAHNKLVALQEANKVLTEALAKLSNSLIAAGNTEPQPWHSDNEKRAFVVMKRMGDDGLMAIARSLME